MFLYICKQAFCKLYGYITRESLELRMRIFQGIIFIWTRTYKEIFKSALVYFKVTKTELFKSSHRSCSIKKGVLKNFAKFTGKHLRQSLYFNKAAGLRPATLLKKRIWQRCFLVNFAKLLLILKLKKLKLYNFMAVFKVLK